MEPNRTYTPPIWIATACVILAAVFACGVLAGVALALK